MIMLKRQSQKNLGDAVINLHLGHCVRICLTDIWVTKSQNDMETRASKYSVINLSFIYENLGCKNGLMLVHLRAIKTQDPYLDMSHIVL